MYRVQAIRLSLLSPPRLQQASVRCRLPGWLTGAAGCVVSHLGTVAVELSELQKWVDAHAGTFMEN